MIGVSGWCVRRGFDGVSVIDLFVYACVYSIFFFEGCAFTFPLVYLLGKIVSGV